MVKHGTVDPKTSFVASSVIIALEEDGVKAIYVSRCACK